MIIDYRDAVVRELEKMRRELAESIAKGSAGSYDAYRASCARYDAYEDAITVVKDCYTKTVNDEDEDDHDD